MIKRPPVLETLPTPQTSNIMAAIKGKGNRSTEERLRILFKKKRIIGWRRHLPLPGRPDFCFPKQRVAIFVDGCFWHGCPTCFKLPKKNTEYWLDKIQRNKARDRKNSRALRDMGWSVMRVWEHALARQPELVIVRVLSQLKKKES